MRNIQIGDQVVMVEFWPNESGTLEPDTSTVDCRLYGVCTEVGDGWIKASPEGDPTDALIFPTTPDGLMQGDSVAFHVDDAPPLTGASQTVQS